MKLPQDPTVKQLRARLALVEQENADLIRLIAAIAREKPGRAFHVPYLGVMAVGPHERLHMDNNDRERRLEVWLSDEVGK